MNKNKQTNKQTNKHNDKFGINFVGCAHASRCTTLSQTYLFSIRKSRVIETQVQKEEQKEDNRINKGHTHSHFQPALDFTSSQVNREEGLNGEFGVLLRVQRMRQCIDGDVMERTKVLTIRSHHKRLITVHASNIDGVDLLL